MPLKEYGVLAARAVARRREGADDTPHYQIHLVDDAGTDYRAAVNVKSQESPSELLYFVDEDLRHPVTESLPAAGSGWSRLESREGEGALDYVRGGLVDSASMRPLPPDLPGAGNDLADLLDSHVQQAIEDETAALYVFGERWGPEGTQDKIFGFRPGNGVHDVHMNQGNSERFRSQDGVWQDGGLFIHLPAESRWVAVFLAFQSQAWQTDDTTGHALAAPPERPTDPQEPDRPGEPDRPEPPGDGTGESVRIVSAMVNPDGGAPEAETVELFNASADAVDLDGWHLSDRNGRRLSLPAQRIEPDARVTVAARDGFQLGNRGGTITLTDPAGRTAHAVSYSAGQAGREGEPISFDA
ncbi:DUF2278 family protein [Streptomyces sp. NPDC007861]|uniref:DUF2278 family protein n=1 Tax=Streptomyces sp. NPDC007861 TaxID=3154893 RepID=UPI0033DF0443